MTDLTKQICRDATLHDVVVRYRCTSEACLRGTTAELAVQEAHLHTLPDEGCVSCGCKRLEILDHPTRGHFVIDWRSQRSLRKRGQGTRPEGLRPLRVTANWEGKR